VDEVVDTSQAYILDYTTVPLQNWSIGNPRQWSHKILGLDLIFNYEPNIQATNTTKIDTMVSAFFVQVKLFNASHDEEHYTQNTKRNPTIDVVISSLFLFFKINLTCVDNYFGSGEKPGRNRRVDYSSRGILVNC